MSISYLQQLKHIKSQLNQRKLSVHNMPLNLKLSVLLMALVAIGGLTAVEEQTENQVDHLDLAIDVEQAVADYASRSKRSLGWNYKCHHCSSCRTVRKTLECSWCGCSHCQCKSCDWRECDRRCENSRSCVAWKHVTDWNGAEKCYFKRSC